MFDPKRYFLELSGAMGLYAGLLVASNLIDDALHPSGAARVALALTPMIGAVVAAWVIVRAILGMDEMHRRIHLEAIAFAFVGTALTTFGWGFAEDAGVPGIEAYAVWPIMAALWIVGLIFARRRYG